MNGGGRRSGTRALQLVFLAVLAFSTAQVLWWIYDQGRLADRDRRLVEALYESEARLARQLLAEGREWSSIASEVPHLVYVGGEARVAPEALEDVAEDRLRRLRRYGWEGAFFLAVLVACMAMIWRTLREEAQLNRRQENFIAAVSHEFKSPLASLQLSLDTIRLRQPGPERLAELLERMDHDVARLDRLVAEVLDSAALESGRRRLEKELVALAESIREVVGDLAPLAAAAQVEFEVDVAGELVVEADPVAVRTVLRNLLDNALRATGARGGGRIRLAAGPAGERIRLQVVDDGVGFPPAEASNLFLKFYRVGDELRRDSKGTGLGLYVVQRLLELEGGHVEAESAGLGRGATFTVTWPRPRGGSRT